MPEDYRDAIRARRLATACRLLAARVATRGVVYLGQSVSDAITHLYAEAGAPYGDGLLGVLMWLDDQAAPEDTPHE